MAHQEVIVKKAVERKYLIEDITNLKEIAKEIDGIEKNAGTEILTIMTQSVLTPEEKQKMFWMNYMT